MGKHCILEINIIIMWKLKINNYLIPEGDRSNKNNDESEHPRRTQHDYQQEIQDEDKNLKEDQYRMLGEPCIWWNHGLVKLKYNLSWWLKWITGINNNKNLHLVASLCGTAHDLDFQERQLIDEPTQQMIRVCTSGGNLQSNLTQLSKTASRDLGWTSTRNIFL